MKDGSDIKKVVLDYRCQRCGAPYIREAEIDCTCELDLQENARSFHSCVDGGVGFGELVGFHLPRRAAAAKCSFGGSGSSGRL